MIVGGRPGRGGASRRRPAGLRRRRAARGLRPVPGALVRPFRRAAHPLRRRPPRRRFRGRARNARARRRPGNGRVRRDRRRDPSRRGPPRRRLRTSYSFLAVGPGPGRPAGPARGRSSARRAGGAGTTTATCCTSRCGSATRYVDPMQLFAPPDLAAIVHLAELPGRPPPRRGRGQAELRRPAIPAVVRAALLRIPAGARATPASRLPSVRPPGRRLPGGRIGSDEPERPAATLASLPDRSGGVVLNHSHARDPKVVPTVSQPIGARAGGRPNLGEARPWPS